MFQTVVCRSRFLYVPLASSFEYTIYAFLSIQWIRVALEITLQVTIILLFFLFCFAVAFDLHHSVPLFVHIAPNCRQQ